jgi:ABC-type uncharacterized transport system involved in gliding motility auxiliary subunit
VRILKEYGIGAGAVLLVAAFILGTLVAEHRTLVWVIAVAGLLLLAGGVALDRERVLSALKGRRARAAGASLGYILAVLAVVVLVNFLAGRHHKRFDLTENKAFSLSEQTLKVLGALPRPVTVTAFFQDVAPTKQKAKDLLEEYRNRGSRLSYEFVDPDTHPAEAKRYGISEYGTIVVESGKQESRVSTADEESLTNAIIKVTRDRERVVYVTTGHGEHDLKDSERGGLSLLKGALEKQHYVVKPLVLSQGVPADASVVLIPGPTKPFLPAEVTMVRDYLDRGGRLFDMQDPETDPGLKDVLGGYGLTIRKDIIIDKVSQLFGSDPRIPMVTPDGYDEFHAVTKNFKYQTFYPLACSIDVASTLPEGVTVTRLAQSSQASWGETNPEEFRTGRITFDKGSDIQGPVAIGVAVVRKKTAPAKPAGETEKTADETRLLVFGDSDFVSNSAFNAAGNGDLALNGVAWLSEQEELVSIRPKTQAPSILVLTGTQALYYFWTIVALAPVAITVVGVGIWVRRKRL